MTDQRIQREGDALKAVVSGGSIAGLAMGVALRSVGIRVSVLERDGGPMRSTGAGIVVQPDLLRLFDLQSGPRLPMTGCSIRRYWSPDGGDGEVQRMPQQFTSWQAIYQTLRAVFPTEMYHTGANVMGTERHADGISVIVDGQDPIDADLLVFAEGAASPARRRLLPDVEARYAGYVAWRGTVAESDMPSGLAAAFDDCFTFSTARSGGHSLAYFIPGDDVQTVSGKRRLNWVWYVGADEVQRDELLVGSDGRRHRASLPRGATPAHVAADMVASAETELHPRFAELIAATQDPFLQTIVDLDVPQTVFGRSVLIGDAAFVVRPHTAAGAAKAARDAMELARALARAGRNVDAALAVFEQSQLDYGRGLLDYGVALGERWAKAARGNPRI